MFRPTVAALLAGLLLAAPPVAAEGPIEVAEARARVLLADRPGAAWLTIRNSGPADRLIGAESPAAARVELHTHIHEGGVMRMREVESIAVPAGGEAVLEPGGDHLMLFGLRPGLAPGDEIPLVLIFERAGRMDVPLGIVPLAETAPGRKRR